MTKAQQLWIEALESGEYSQSIGGLQDEKGFCCLGVACAVYEKENNIVLRKSEYGHIFGGTLSGSHKEVRRWLGLRNAIGEPPINDKYNSLVDLNDNGTPFKEIAKLLREHPEIYFEETK